MGFGDDEEILQDFLVEAGEILEQLSEQLVELEQRPEDKDLLNAIFRGFHTVKGGAGFLQLDAMVDCCHVTENLFDMLRNGKCSITSEMMDVVLKALDTINAQYQQISQSEPAQPADPDLIYALEGFVSGRATAPAEVSAESAPFLTPAESKASENQKVGADPDAITDEEFEQLLDAIHSDSEGNSNSTSVVRSSTNNDEISEDEFEALLDQLHGQGKGPSGVNTTQAEVENNVSDSKASPSQSGSSSGPSSSGNDDEISEQEFEALLDQLHGQGKGPGTGVRQDAARDKADVDGKQATGDSAQSAADADIITEQEFDALLDQLHSKGKRTGAEPTSRADRSSKAESNPGKDSEKDSGKKDAAGNEIEKNAIEKNTSSGQSDKQAQPAQSVSKSATATNGPQSTGTRSTGQTAGSSSGRSAAPKEKVPAQNMAAAAETTVRVDTQRLDDIMNMVGELVLVRNRLVRLGVDSSDEALSKAVANLDVVTADLQTSVMKTRMQPIKKVFGRFPRVVRDLARNLKKEINLELLGEETDLDKNLVEALADPLVHLVRNAVDHGIELPEDREKSGKPRVGQVILAAEQEGDHILLSITDDGAGMDPEALRKKAVEKGLFDEDAVARLSDTEAFNLIFAPGFSTKVEISDVSGRGVGMDVVKTKITQLNGTIDITSKVGEGSRISIKVPLTLAIMPTLMIMLDEQTFALPLVSVNEIFQMDLTKANIVDGQECVTIRNKSIPIFHLKRWLVKGHSANHSQQEAHVVIVSVGTKRVGFVVDQLIGQEEVVIKPLGRMLHGTPGMAGATITGDGTIALILDVPSMLKRYANSA